MGSERVYHLFYSLSLHLDKHRYYACHIGTLGTLSSTPCAMIGSAVAVTRSALTLVVAGFAAFAFA